MVMVGGPGLTKTVTKFAYIYICNGAKQWEGIGWSGWHVPGYEKCDCETCNISQKEEQEQGFVDRPRVSEKNYR
jgi:hypothetical protein